MKRILVTGSRTWTAWQVLDSALDEWCRKWTEENVTIVHGDAPSGADNFAKRYAAVNKVRVEEHPASWDTNPRSAGIIRNNKMVGLGADVCLAFFTPCTKPRCSYNVKGLVHLTHGTTHCARAAKHHGIEVVPFFDKGATEDMYTRAMEQR